jgi:phosphoesterase RecJ-like protein
MLDHHPDASRQGHIHVFDPDAPATGTLVFELLGHLGVTADRAIATCLYTALLTDTGRFSYSNTTPYALRVAASLIEAGADPNAVFTAAYEDRSRGAQRLIGLALERITLANDGRVAYSWIASEDLTSTGARPEETENLIDHLRALGGVDVVVLLKAGDDVVRGSLRAKGDADVGSVARQLGGGGHRAAAGFTVDGDVTGALARVLPLLPGGHE